MPSGAVHPNKYSGIRKKGTAGIPGSRLSLRSAGMTTEETEPYAIAPAGAREPAPDLIRGRLARGAFAERSTSGEGAFPQAQTREKAPSPGFRRSASLRSESDLSP